MRNRRNNKAYKMGVAIMTRGERNNNPCNIRISDNPWQGKVVPSQDPAFEQFDTPANGIRAAAKLLLTYYKKYGLNTLQGIISRWAPSNENDTISYVGDVCAHMEISSGGPVVLTNLTTLVNLVCAIIYHENGENIYPRSEVAQACQDAL